MEPTSEPDMGNQFASNLIESIFTQWVEPELSRRGLPVDRATILKVMVEFVPGSDQVPKVSLNEECQLLAKAKSSKSYAKGEHVYLDDLEDIEHIKPAIVGQNNGWLVLALIGSQYFAAFDFRYNKAKATELLDLAQSYVNVSKEVLSANPRPAIDNLYSAAELTIQAQMLSQSQGTRKHFERQIWLDEWVANKNAPEGFQARLRKLHSERAAARYADGHLTLNALERSETLDGVQEMIDFARKRVL